MAVNYNKLWKMMIDKNMSKTELTHLAGISTNAMAKLGRNEDVRVNVLEKLCTSLDCKLDDIQIKRRRCKLQRNSTQLLCNAKPSADELICFTICLQGLTPISFQ